MTRGAAESLGCYPGGESGKQVGLIVTVALTLLFGLGLIVLWGLTVDLDAMSASFVVLVATVYGFYRLWPSFASSVVDVWPDVEQQSLLELGHPPAQGARGDDGGTSDERATRSHETGPGPPAPQPPPPQPPQPPAPQPPEPPKLPSLEEVYRSVGALPAPAEHVPPFQATPCGTCRQTVHQLTSSYVSADTDIFPECWRSARYYGGPADSPQAENTESLRFCRDCRTIWWITYDHREGYFNQVEAVPPIVPETHDHPEPGQGVIDAVFDDYFREFSAILCGHHARQHFDASGSRLDLSRRVEALVEGTSRRPLSLLQLECLIDLLIRTLGRASQKRVDRPSDDFMNEAIEEMQDEEFKAETLLVALGKLDRAYANAPFVAPLSFGMVVPCLAAFAEPTLFRGLDLVEVATVRKRLLGLADRIIRQPCLVDIGDDMREAYSERERFRSAFRRIEQLDVDSLTDAAGLIETTAFELIQDVIEVSPSAPSDLRSPRYTHEQLALLRVLRDALKKRPAADERAEPLASCLTVVEALTRAIHGHRRTCMIK